MNLFKLKFFAVQLNFMIEDTKVRKALHELMMKSNVTCFGKDVTKLLQEHKTPYVAYERMLVHGNRPWLVSDEIGMLDLQVGTAVNLEERGIVCANSSRKEVLYYAEKGRLAKDGRKIENSDRSLMYVPMDGLSRVIDTISRYFPALDIVMSDGDYNIYHGTILEKDHHMKAEASENSMNRTTLHQLKKESEKKYGSLLSAVAAER